jgi:hypothetical protein
MDKETLKKYLEILELDIDTNGDEEVDLSLSLSDIKEAYQRLKTLYTSEAMSLVTEPIEDEFSREEQEEILNQLEEAYNALLHYMVERDRAEKEAFKKAGIIEDTVAEFIPGESKEDVEEVGAVNEDMEVLELPEVEELLESQELIELPEMPEIPELPKTEMGPEAPETMEEAEEVEEPQEVEEAEALETMEEAEEVEEPQEVEEAEAPETMEEAEEVEEPQEVEEAEAPETMEEAEEVGEPQEVEEVEAPQAMEAESVPEISAVPEKPGELEKSKEGEEREELEEEEIAEGLTPTEEELEDEGLKELELDKTMLEESDKFEDIKAAVSPPDPNDLLKQGKSIKGRTLRKAREKLEIGIHEIAVSTGISYKILVNIEKEQYQKLPEPGYLRWLITTYAKALSLDPKKVADDYMSRYRKWQRNQES